MAWRQLKVSLENGALAVARESPSESRASGECRAGPGEVWTGGGPESVGAFVCVSAKTRECAFVHVYLVSV